MEIKYETIVIARVVKHDGGIETRIYGEGKNEQEALEDLLLGLQELNIKLDEALDDY